MTRHERYAVIGDPIDHSLSPAMHNAAFQALRIDARYEAVRVPSDQLESWIGNVRAGAFAGCNVTIPHKETVRASLDEIDAVGEYMGAVNTVVNTSGRLKGFNTDVEGFAGTVMACGIDPARCRAVVVGAGGSARAVVYALTRRGASLTILARDITRGLRLAGALGTKAPVYELTDFRATAAVQAADLLVNATPIGMRDFPGSPLPSRAQLHSGQTVIDLVYGRMTPLLVQAREAGCVTADGTDMLVRQGAASFRLWTGLEPDLRVMLDACRAASREVSACSAS